MRKIFFLLLLIFCLDQISFGQKTENLKFSLGADVTYTSSDLLVFWGTGLGASAQAEYSFSKKVSGSLLIGNSDYLGVSIFGGYKQPALHVIPLRAGVRYYVLQRLYLAAQAGTGFISGGGEGAVLLGLKGSYFSYSPQLGYLFKIKNKNRIDLAVKYESYSKSPNNFSDGGVRIAYIF